MKLSMKMVIGFCLTITTFISLALVFMSPPVQAASVIADTPCDPQYYESLSARAWLEAQREITQNQNLILKPDSVLEYTCFDRLVRELADHADEMFSETSRYGNPLGNTSMDDALQALVGTSIMTYIDNNFGSKGPGVPNGYNLLSGHTAGAGINHVPLEITKTPSYSCDIMSRVWQAAKCINFVTNSNTDGFFTFTEYANSVTDKRVLPTQACTPIFANWSANLNVALTSGPWTNDPIVTYFNLTDPVDCGTAGGNCQCTGAPVPTGVTVVRTGYNVNEYPEMICIQPGCHYHPGTVAGKVDDLASGVAEPNAGCYGL